MNYRDQNHAWYSATPSVAVPYHLPPSATQPRGRIFDWCYLPLCAWILVGEFGDRFFPAPNLSALPTLTIWRIIIGTGVLLVGGLLFFTRLTRWRKQVGWPHTIPRGYEEVVAGGIPGFFMGGIAEIAWRLVFGAQSSQDAWYAPAHLLMEASIGLIILGPYRALYFRASSRMAEKLLLTLTHLLFFAFLTMVLLPIHPIMLVTAGPSTAPVDPVLLTLALLINSMLVSLVFLFAIRRWSLPLGQFSLIYTGTALPISILVHNPLLALPALLAGLLTDGAYWVCRPDPIQPKSVRCFACCLPCLWVLASAVTILLTRASPWSFQQWLALLTGAGLLGWLLSFVVLPPGRPDGTNGTA